MVFDFFFFFYYCYLGLKKREKKEREEEGEKRNILSRQLSQSGRNVTRISHEYYDDLQTKRDAIENEKNRQKKKYDIKEEIIKESS